MSEELALSGKEGAILGPGQHDKLAYIDVQGVPGGKASTEVEAAAVKGEMGVVDLERLWSNVPSNNIAWSAHRELCQRVTDLEAKVAELLEEKNEPPDPDWDGSFR